MPSIACRRPEPTYVDPSRMNAHLAQRLRDGNRPRIRTLSRQVHINNTLVPDIPMNPHENGQLFDLFARETPLEGHRQ